MKRWQKVELTYLKKHQNDKSLEELAERFGTETKTVAAKLAELRRAALSSAGSPDASAAAFGEGVQALHEQRWPEAAAAFDRVLADPESPELHARARGFLSLARERADSTPVPETDPYLAVVVAKNQGDLDTARTGCLAAERHLTDERFAYLLSVVELLRGEESSAAEALARAIDLEPRNRWRATRDRDLTALRGSHPALFG